MMETFAAGNQPPGQLRVQAMKGGEGEGLLLSPGEGEKWIVKAATSPLRMPNVHPVPPRVCSQS